MNKRVQEKFENIVKTLDKFVSEVNSNEFEYCWTYDYSSSSDHFTLWERNKETGETNNVQIPCKGESLCITK